MSKVEKSVTRCDSSASIRQFHLVPIENFSGLKFPTNSEVLRRYFYIRDHSSKSRMRRDIAAQIYEEVNSIYGKVPCVMKTKRFCIDQICLLYNKWNRLRLNEWGASEKFISCFEKELEKTCNLVGKNAIHQIQTDKCRDQKRRSEDERFVKNQITTREGKFWTSDSIYSIVQKTSSCQELQIGKFCKKWKPFHF